MNRANGSGHMGRKLVLAVLLAVLCIRAASSTAKTTSRPICPHPLPLTTSPPTH